MRLIILHGSTDDYQTVRAHKTRKKEQWGANVQNEAKNNAATAANSRTEDGLATSS